MQCSILSWMISFSSHSSVESYTEESVLETFVLKSFWCIVIMNWTACKYFNILNLNGLNFYCYRFQSMYGYSHEKYRKKMLCFWNTLLPDSCNTPLGCMQSHNKKFQELLQGGCREQAGAFLPSLPFTMWSP